MPIVVLALPCERSVLRFKTLGVPVSQVAGVTNLKALTRPGHQDLIGSSPSAG